MTSEDLKVRITLFILVSIALASMNFGQIVMAQNSTSSDVPDSSQEQSTSEVSKSEPDAGSDTNESGASENSTQTTDASSQGNASTTQNTNSTGSSDQEQQSGNGTSTAAEMYDGNKNQNNTASENNDEDVDEGQSNNGTYAGNQTVSENDSSAYSNDNQATNENATVTFNENMMLTDFVAVNHTAAPLQPAPDFGISIDPLTMTIDAGSSTTYSITVSSINGFNSDVSLSMTSDSIAGITSSLSSNVTRPPPNAYATSLLTIQSDPAAQSGEHRLKVTASFADTSKSAAVTLEVTGRNVTLDEIEQFDPVALTPVLIKDLQDNILDNVSSNRMVLISTTVTNNYDRTQPFIVVVEVRDSTDGITYYLQLQKGVLNPLGEAEVAISWTPDKAGTYQVRAFAINEIKENPEPLSVLVGKTIEVR